MTSTDGTTYTIAWVAPAGTEVTVYAGTDLTAIGRDHLVGRGRASGQLVARDLPPAARWYFELVASRGHSLVIADRSLHLATAPNFRDAGGYRTADGRWVRMGLVYRSDQLDKLGDADLETLTRDHVPLVCDLRTDQEREVFGNGGAQRIMTEGYRRFVDSASALHAYHAVQFAHLKPGIDRALLEPILNVDASYLDEATLTALRAEFLTR